MGTFNTRKEGSMFKDKPSFIVKDGYKFCEQCQKPVYLTKGPTYLTCDCNDCICPADGGIPVNEGTYQVESIFSINGTPNAPVLSDGPGTVVQLDLGSTNAAPTVLDLSYTNGSSNNGEVYITGVSFTNGLNNTVINIVNVPTLPLTVDDGDTQGLGQLELATSPATTTFEFTVTIETNAGDIVIPYTYQTA